MGLDSSFRRLSVNVFEQLCAHISNTQEHRIVVENLIINGTVKTKFSENKTIPKLHFER